MTCWEIFTGGQAPYAGTKPSSLLSLLQEGERLEIPKNSACSDDMYEESNTYKIHYVDVYCNNFFLGDYC